MKVWVDVTGLYHWSGNFTGIQRVVYNLAKLIDSSDINSGIFVYNSGTYSEISFSQLEHKLSEANKRTSINQQESKISYLRPTKVIYYSLITMKKLVKNSALEGPLRKFYGFARNSYRSLRSIPATLQHQHIFNEHDTVMVIDGNWLLPGFAESIITERNNSRFFLLQIVQDLIAYNNPALVNKGANKTIGNYFKKVFNAADGLIAISESTKNDIEWFLKINKVENKPKLFTITLGADFKDKPTQLKPKFEFPKEFILAVSTIEVRKNYLAFYYIYNLAFQKGITLPHLVIVGRKGWMADETYALLTEDPKISKSVTILNASDDELSWLYRNCLFTVFPSFYEGWGLPIVESLIYGKACISSNTSSMREAGGNLISYVSPYDPAGFMNEIIRLCNGEVRHKMEHDIRANYKPVTWQQTFEQVRDIIGDVSGQKV